MKTGTGVFSAELVIGLVILQSFVSTNRKRVQKHLASLKESSSHVVTTVKQLSSAELEQELSKRRLDGEQELLDACLKSNVQVVTGAVGRPFILA